MIKYLINKVEEGCTKFTILQLCLNVIIVVICMQILPKKTLSCSSEETHKCYPDLSSVILFPV